MTPKLRELTDAELNNRGMVFYLKTERGEAKVTIKQSIGYQWSRVRLYEIVEGDFGKAHEGDWIDVPNGQLYVPVGQ